MSSRNILFLTLLRVDSIDERGIYTDLLRNLENKGNKIFIATPLERRLKLKTNLSITERAQILSIKTLNIQKTNLFEKGLATLAVEYQYLFAIKKYFGDVKFDLILYSTPPVTFCKVINFVKSRDSALSYLLLKDIFPQNAIDLNLFRKNGVVHKFFLKKEKQLYAISDFIGCMSEANVKFIIRHNPNLDSSKVFINPNSINPISTNYTLSEKESIKAKYSIPHDKKIFIYGGNLGKPQGLDFLLETISQTKRSDVYFVVVGSGTELTMIKSWFMNNKPQNAALIPMLTKSEYDKLLGASDVGLIFLNKNFTIPNYPSRLLSYLEMKMPVITATDTNTDIGEDVIRNNCGFAVSSGDISGMLKAINTLMDDDVLFNEMKVNAWIFLNRDFHVNQSSNLIMNVLKGKTASITPVP